MKPKRRKLLLRVLGILKTVNDDLKRPAHIKHTSVYLLNNLGDAIALLQNDLDLDELKAKTNENAAGRCK